MQAFSVAPTDVARGAGAQQAAGRRGSCPGERLTLARHGEHRTQRPPARPGRTRRMIDSVALVAECIIAILTTTLLPHLAIAQAASLDVGTELAGLVFNSGNVIEDATAPALPAVDLGPLPAGADVVAYTKNDVGDRFFVLGHTMELAGGVFSTPHRVMTWDPIGSVYDVEVDLATLGLPPGAAIDALGVILSTPGVGISFDTTAEFLGVTVAAADVLELFSSTIVFDASAAGLAPGIDLDAFSEASNGDFLVSFDIGGAVGGITFADEDVLRVTVPGYIWTMEIDASLTDDAWHRSDVDAFLPEPGGAVQLIAGSLWLLALALSRRRSRA